MTKTKSCCIPSGAHAGSVANYPAFARINRGSAEDMVELPGGAFLMGTEDEIGFPDDGEGPVRSTGTRSPGRPYLIFSPCKPDQIVGACMSLSVRVLGESGKEDL
jgi:hypothetical protein